MECPHCHAQISADSSTCPECGSALGANSSRDESVGAELAKANVLRMRGDLRGAESQLLSLLKKYPNNATAHEMLGDMFLDSGEDAQAASWYELALDLDPNSVGLASKLQRARTRIEEHEETEAVEQIGLSPSNSNRTWLYVGVGFVLAAVLVLSTMALMNRYGTPKTVQVVIPAPPEAKLEGSPTGASPNPATSESPVVQASVTPSPTVVQDQAALALLTQKAPDGSRLLALTSDPRAESMMLTFAVHQGDDPKPIAARLAKSALEQYGGCATVTIRGSLDGKLVFVADEPRTRLVETETSEWQQANPAEDAWIAYVLTNEWSSLPTASPSPSVSPDPSATSTAIIPVNPP